MSLSTLALTLFFMACPGSAAAGTIHIQPSESYGRPRVEVALSQDGKLLAWAQQVFDDNGKLLGMAVHVNGMKMGGIYDYIKELTFSEDSLHVAWIGLLSGKGCVVLDGAPGPMVEFPVNIEISKGGAIAYLAEKGGIRKFFINHKPISDWPHEGLVLSPDWSKIASGRGPEGKKRAYINETPIGNPYAAVFGFQFSPDGTRMAYISPSPRTRSA